MSEITTILIVDDEPAGRETLDALLSSHGYQLRFAGNGPDALDLAAAQPPDLILLDVMMPGMDGFAVCRRLRADPRLGEVPVIMLTALDDRESRLQGIEAGADDFISKPFDRVELRARVRTITRLNRYRRLLAERARFEWVVEQVDDGYLMVGETGNVLYANPQARLYLGIAPDAGEHGATFPELASKQYDWKPRADWAAWVARPAGAPPTPHYLIRPASKNADQFMLQVDLFEMASDPGARYLIRLRDITARIIDLNAVWSFQGLVRHKINTALAQLIGALQTFKELRLDVSEGLGANIFGIALDGAADLKSEFLDIFQYLEAPDLLRPERGRCNLADIASILSPSGIGLDIRPIQIAHAGIEDPSGLWLAISRQGIELVLRELIENARKFHPQQLPAIDVVLSRVADAVHIRVHDDGQTLAPDQLAKAWQPYYQGERYFTGQLAGMGLGLPMVAALIWRIGGSCRIYNRESGPGVGVELIVPLACGEGL